jgi:hypothetical protein
LGDRLYPSTRRLSPGPAVSLSLEPAHITSIANDLGTEVIFLRQLIAQAQPGDVAIGISTSGGSRNIITALEEARKRDLLTVALLRDDGGEILRKGLADFPLLVHCDYIPRIQEVQASKHWRCWIVPRLELHSTARCPTPRRCGTGWSSDGVTSWNMTWKTTLQFALGCANEQAANETCLCCRRMVRCFKSAGRDAVAS